MTSLAKRAIRQAMHAFPSTRGISVLAREAEGCFEVTMQATVRLRCLTRGRGAHRRLTGHEANEAALHGAGAGEEERWEAQGGPGW